MAEDGERKKGKAEGREKGAIRWRGEEEMVAAQEKWPDIGERISCVGPFVMLRPVTEEGEWMEVQRVAAQGEGAEVVGVVGGEWWTVGLSHQGCLLTCATKRDIHQAGRRRRFTQPHGRGNTCAHARLTLTQKGTVITARGPCASPRKLYYTLQCGGMFHHTTFRCRKRCCCSLLFIHLGGFSTFLLLEGFCPDWTVVLLVLALSCSMHHCHLIDSFWPSSGTTLWPFIDDQDCSVCVCLSVVLFVLNTNMEAFPRSCFQAFQAVTDRAAIHECLTRHQI